MEDKLVEFIEVTCKENPNGGKPYFDPPYNHIVNPFPPCFEEVYGKTLLQGIDGHCGHFVKVFGMVSFKHAPIIVPQKH